MNGKVVYTSPFVPSEWIEAHGLTPVRVPGAPMAVAAGAGVCPIAGGFAEAAERGEETVVFATTCDQMRRASETIEGGRAFVMNVPALWGNPASRQLYRQELLRLGRFLISRGGRECGSDKLARVMMEHDRRRAAQRAGAPIAAGVARVALVGGALRSEDGWIMRLLESRGACVALDATETGQRTLPARFEPARLAGDPLGELVRAYFDNIPDAFRRPLSMLHQYLTAAFDRLQIQAVVLIRGVWCDLWHAQMAWLRQLGRPVAEVDLDDSSTASPEGPERFRTRIEAMLEAIR